MLRAGNKSLVEDASYLLSDLLRGVVEKQDVIKSILYSLGILLRN